MFRERFARIRPLGVALFALALVAGPIAAQEEEGAAGRQPNELGRALLERYEIRTDDEIIILEPRDGASAVREIEIDGEDVLVNGKRFDESELAAFLGGDGERIRELVALDDDGRLEALGFPELPKRSRRDGEVDISVPLGVPGPRIHVRPSGDERVSIGRSIHLEKGETASNVVCIGCSVQIDGHDSGDAVAIGGSVRVNGTVEGNAVSVGGSVNVADGATVEGDGVSVGGGVSTDGSGEIQGEHVGVGIGGAPWMGWGEWPWGMFSDASRFASAVIKTGLLALLGALAFLVARPAIDTGAARVASEPWKAAFAGLLTQLLIGPVFILVIVVLAVSIIGIPLLLLMPFAIIALMIGWFFGFVAVARALGGWFERRLGWSGQTAVLAIVVGVVIIQAISLLGRALSIPGGAIGAVGFSLVALGFFLKYVAWTIGLGAMTLIALTGDWRRPSTVFAAPPPPAPEQGGAVDDMRITPRYDAPAAPTAPAAEPRIADGDDEVTKGS